MECYRCKNLDSGKKSAGKVSGNLYYCKKLKIYVNPSKFTCEKFDKTDKKSWETDEIYNEGKKYYNDSTPLSFYVVILIILIIVGIFLGVFN